jgi:hypothetical protein
MNGFAGIACPQHRGLPLIGQADARDVATVQPCRRKCGPRHRKAGLPDFQRVVFDQTWRGEILLERALRAAQNAELGIEHQRASAGGALIQHQ